jgi:hypothetical protein
MKCLLCKENEADKKGSHIIPHFLLETLINYDGRKGRDKEIVFSFNNLESSVYFGRSVSPEMIDALKGCALDEDELKANRDPHVIDYLFCSDCERKLSVIEAEYAERHNKGADVHPNISFLFWLSVLWRMSITGDYNISLDADIEEGMRKVLSGNLAFDRTAILDKQIEIRGWGYLLLRFPADGYESCVVGYPYSNSPYLWIVNDYVICFFADTKNLTLPAFPIISELQQFMHEGNISTCSRSEICVHIKSEFKRGFLEKATHYFAEKQMCILYTEIDHVLKQIGIEPSFDLTMAIITKYTGENPDSKFIIGRYNRANLKKIIAKNLS